MPRPISPRERNSTDARYDVSVRNGIPLAKEEFSVLQKHLASDLAYVRAHCGDAVDADGLPTATFLDEPYSDERISRAILRINALRPEIEKRREEARVQARQERQDAKQLLLDVINNAEADAHAMRQDAIEISNACMRIQQLASDLRQVAQVKNVLRDYRTLTVGVRAATDYLGGDMPILPPLPDLPPAEVVYGWWKLFYPGEADFNYQRDSAKRAKKAGEAVGSILRKEGK